MNQRRDDDQADIAEIIDLGSEVAGSLIGAGVGLVIAGPPGAIIGAAASPAATRLLKTTGEFAARLLSGREKARVGAVVIYANAVLAEAIKSGRSVRNDGFFEADTDGRVPMDEAAEGVLRAAQEEYEERKLPYMGKLLAAIALESGIDRGTAASLIRQAQDLTYRQLLLLALFSRSEEFDLRSTHYRTRQLSDMDPEIPLLTEIADLTRRGLASLRGDTMVGVKDTIPSVMEPFGLGVWLVRLMELTSVDAAELEPLAIQLRGLEEHEGQSPG